MGNLLRLVTFLLEELYPELRMLRLAWPTFIDRTRRLSLDVRMGRCSGFRPCCVAFFTHGWSPWWGAPFQTPIRGWRAKYWKWLGYDQDGLGFGYIPCPLCHLRRSYVRVRRCDDRCGHLRECGGHGRSQRRRS